MTPLTPEQQAALENLRDIRLPEPVSWWPLAPGWWALLALALLAATTLLAWRILRRRTRRFAALGELGALRARIEAGEGVGVVADLAALVRRVALSARGPAVAPLSDRAWAEALSRGPEGLPPEVARLIAEAPYRQPERLDRREVAGLIAPVEAWIRRTA
ncbi:MAG: DUF4381 domain-containing protein [Maritimibacter sp.]|nr:DUF4381 domain-containing protein [Maritimibacter sp.]